MDTSRLGAARTRVYSSGRGGGRAVFRANLVGWQKFLELAKIKHITGDAIDESGAEISVILAHVVRAKTLEPFEVHQDPAVKIEGKLSETIHAFSHDSCWACDPVLWEIASHTETPPSDPPGDSLTASLNAQIAHDAFKRGDRFLVRVRSLEPEPGFATISSRIWAREKRAARRDRKGRR